MKQTTSPVLIMFRIMAHTSIGLLFTCTALHASESFPVREMLRRASYVIEYSKGDEAYAEALARRLPIEFSMPAQDSVSLPLTASDLGKRRAEVLSLVAGQLALPSPTMEMQQTYDRFLAAYAALQSMKLAPHANRFALWRKEEIDARMRAGQTVSGFSRDSDGEIVFSLGISLESREGEPFEAALSRAREELEKLTWPIKIGEDPSVSAEEEIAQRLTWVREAASQLAGLQSAEFQRLSVMIVLHETIEATLVSLYIRSADRRWFCEGVSNYASLSVIEALIGEEAAHVYYDVAAETQKYAALRERVDLVGWPVLEHVDSQKVPPDVNAASYAFATASIAAAFAGTREGALPAVLAEVRKTPISNVDMRIVYDAYTRITGRDLRPYIEDFQRVNR